MPTYTIFRLSQSSRVSLLISNSEMLARVLIVRVVMCCIDDRPAFCTQYSVLLRSGSPHAQIINPRARMRSEGLL